MLRSVLFLVVIDFTTTVQNSRAQELQYDLDGDGLDGGEIGCCLAQTNEIGAEELK